MLRHLVQPPGFGTSSRTQPRPVPTRRSNKQALLRRRGVPVSFVHDAVEFYREGGWGMHLITSCLIAAVAITLERFKVLFLDCSENKHALLTGLNQHIMRGDVQAAIRWLSSQKQGPLSRILRAGLLKAHRPDKEIQAALDQASLSEVPKIEARTGYLAVLSNAATLAALLGTISGLIKTFGAVA